MSLLGISSLFVTRQCGDTHIGYAISQIKKARGQNKRVNNPKPPETPRKKDFCFVIAKDNLIASGSPPCRPVSLNQIGWLSGVVLLAGGIGVTPLLAMAEQLAAAATPFTLHYCARSKDRAAFLDRIAQARFSSAVCISITERPRSGSTSMPRSP